MIEKNIINKYYRNIILLLHTNNFICQTYGKSMDFQFTSFRSILSNFFRHPGLFTKSAQNNSPSPKTYKSIKNRKLKVSTNPTFSSHKYKIIKGRKLKLELY